MSRLLAGSIFFLELDGDRKLQLPGGLAFRSHGTNFGSASDVESSLAASSFLGQPHTSKAL